MGSFKPAEADRARRCSVPGFTTDAAAVAKDRQYVQCEGEGLPGPHGNTGLSSASSKGAANRFLRDLQT